MDPPSASSAGHSRSGSSPSATVVKVKAPQKKSTPSQQKKQKQRNGSIASMKQPSNSNSPPSEPSHDSESSGQSTTIVEREVSQSQDNANGEAMIVYDHSEHGNDQSEPNVRGWWVVRWSVVRCRDRDRASGGGGPVRHPSNSRK